MNKCTHPKDRESIKQCALRFGDCYKYPPRTKTKHLISNKPHGTSARDISFNQN